MVVREKRDEKVVKNEVREGRKGGECGRMSTTRCECISANARRPVTREATNRRLWQRLEILAIVAERQGLAGRAEERHLCRQLGVLLLLLPLASAPRPVFDRRASNTIELVIVTSK